jgi:ribosomal small subunit protein bTHX
MGRGDKRTAKGKRFKASFGNSRPQRLKVDITGGGEPKKAKVEKAEKAEKPTAAKKAPAKKKAEKPTAAKKAPAKKKAE